MAAGIDLIDNTTPSQTLERDLTRADTRSSYHNLRKRLTRDSVKNELQRRKYAKWQRERLDASDSDSNQRARRLYLAATRPTTKDDQHLDREDADDANGLLNVEPVQSEATENIRTTEDDANASAELEMLYENQRGWFFFGIPFYSSQSLLQFDPPAWVNGEYRDSPVNITNAQLPDPSWEWAWPTWYVEMSGDVDEEGWQYSFSFFPKLGGWHGTHPWFHSYVRRRRWVRLRVKKHHAGLGKPVNPADFHQAHLLNEDYFSIHSQLASAALSIATSTRRDVPSSSFVRRGENASPERPPDDEIDNIPRLLDAVKSAVVDRQKIEALKEFLNQGGEELYYLPDKVPELLSLFLFQATRWQFLKILQEAQDNSIAGEQDGADAEELDRRRNNISRTIDAVKKALSNSSIFDIAKDNLDGLHESASKTKHQSSSRSKGKQRSWKEISGIPKAAAVGKEGHIY